MTERVLKPDVSFIVATRAENPQYLAEAIASMLNQAVINLEIVLVVDGEDAYSRATGVLVGLEDSRLRYFVSHRNRGLARCLNIAVRLSRGKYLARMDDDDRCLPDRLVKQVQYMRNEQLQVCGTFAYAMDENGDRYAGEIIKSDPSVAFRPTGAVFGNIFLHPTVMMECSWAKKNKYDPKWGRGQDRELWVRTRSFTRFGCIQEPLLEYRRGVVLKKIQLANVISGFTLIWRYRLIFGIFVPWLLMINSLRWLVYRLRTLLYS